MPSTTISISLSYSFPQTSHRSIILLLFVLVALQVADCGRDARSPRVNVPCAGSLWSLRPFDRARLRPALARSISPHPFVRRVRASRRPCDRLRQAWGPIAPTLEGPQPRFGLEPGPPRPIIPVSPLPNPTPKRYPENGH